MLNRCPFCAVERDPTTIETEHAVAFLDAFPVVQGHSLVVPRRHVASLYELSPVEEKAVWQLVGQVRAQLAAQLGPDGFDVGLNDGLGAGQTVTLAHVHVIRRWKNDVSDPRGGIRWVIADNAYWKD